LYTGETLAVRQSAGTSPVIMQHAEENNILYPLQHGFRKGRSCETQLIEFVEDI
jgi:hypothetical protein